MAGFDPSTEGRALGHRADGTGPDVHDVARLGRHGRGGAAGRDSKGAVASSPTAEPRPVRSSWRPCGRRKGATRKAGWACREPGSVSYNAAVDSAASHDTDSSPAAFAQRVYREAVSARLLHRGPSRPHRGFRSGPFDQSAIGLGFQTGQPSDGQHQQTSRFGCVILHGLATPPSWKTAVEVREDPARVGPPVPISLPWCWRAQGPAECWTLADHQMLRCWRASSDQQPARVLAEVKARRSASPLLSRGSQP